MKNIKDIWEDYIVWYLWDKPKDIYKTIRHWWWCNGSNPWHWKMVWYDMFHHYGWDNSFMYEHLYREINKTKYYFEKKCCILSEESIAERVRWMNIALSLLEIITEKRNLFEMVADEGTDGMAETEKLDNGCYRLVKTNVHYVSLVKVNMKNKDRFPQRCYDWNTNKVSFSTDCYRPNESDDELYKRKAQVLLLRILQDYATDWWD